MLYPVIDIGSNTVKIAILDADRLFSSHPIYFKAVPLGLRSKVENGRLCDCAIKELGAELAAFQNTAKQYTSQTPLAFATASLRGLDNVDEVLSYVLSESGIAVEVLSGDREAYYSFLGARRGAMRGTGIVADLGGGSMELVTFAGKNIKHSVSLPIGCLPLYHRYFEGEKDGFNECRAHVHSLLEQGAPPKKDGDLLLCGGSAKALLKYKNTLENKKNSVIGARQMRRIYHHYINPTLPEHKTMKTILKDRFRLVPPALAVFEELLDFYKIPRARVCKSGVREGRLFAYLHKLDKN